MNPLTASFDVSYPAFRLQTDLTLPGRGVTVVFGPSGCGKTTFLRCLSGLERSPSGFMKLGDEVWQDESRGIFVPVTQRALGMVFQEPRLFAHMTVAQNLNYGLRRTPEAKRTLQAEHVIDIMGLGSLLKRRPHRLSGGEKQRVAIGRALLRSPRLLLMDEPLSALDAARKQEILPFFLRLREELDIPIVYVSHSLNEVLQLVDTMVLLEAGRVLACGPVAEVFSRLDLRGHLEPNMIGSILDTQVVDHETEFGLTRLAFQGQGLSVPRQETAVGLRVRLHILAQDVSIVIDPPDFRTSVLNILKARVVEVGEIDPESYSVDIKLDVGAPLLVTITRKSLARLDLRPGQQVYAHIKAIKTIQSDPQTEG